MNTRLTKKYLKLPAEAMPNFMLSRMYPPYSMVTSEVTSVNLKIRIGKVAISKWVLLTYMDPKTQRNRSKEIIEKNGVE